MRFTSTKRLRYVLAWPEILRREQHRPDHLMCLLQQTKVAQVKKFSMALCAVVTIVFSGIQARAGTDECNEAIHRYNNVINDVQTTSSVIHAAYPIVRDTMIVRQNSCNCTHPRTTLRQRSQPIRAIVPSGC